MASAKFPYMSLIDVNLPKGCSLHSPSGNIVATFDPSIHEKCIIIPKQLGDIYLNDIFVYLVETRFPPCISFHVHEFFVKLMNTSTQSVQISTPQVSIPISASRPTPSNFGNGKSLVYVPEIVRKFSTPLGMGESGCDCGAFKTYGAQKGSPLHTRDGRGIQGCSWRNKELDNT